MKNIIKTLSITLVALFLAGPTVALADDDEKVDKATVEKIMAKLKEMKCEMDPKDIEKEDDGYELDDVFCEGGKQFDIELDKDLNETGRKAE
ncbi:MAG: PepSY domain-containing protein [Hyphomicrobiales bacterium]